MEIGYHASHEQFSPGELRDLAVFAEQAGFAHAMCSDHFHPWSSDQGHSAFSWSWLGAALEATGLSFGTITPPIGYRYHPTIIAQAVGTLSQMYGGRFEWLAIGSGEALNEHIVGKAWPAKADRNAMLAASAEIMRALWAGETVTRDGPIAVDEAKLFCLPQDLPPLFCAALTPETAQMHAEWSDGLLTVNQPQEQLDAVIGAYQRGGGTGKALYLQVHLSWAATDDLAAEQALRRWRTNLVPAALASELRMPEDFERAAKSIEKDDLAGRVLCSADLDQHAEWLAQYRQMGFERLYLHFVGENQKECIEAFAQSVLPKLRR